MRTRCHLGVHLAGPGPCREVEPEEADSQPRQSRVAGRGGHGRERAGGAVVGAEEGPAGPAAGQVRQAHQELSVGKDGGLELRFFRVVRARNIAAATPVRA